MSKKKTILWIPDSKNKDVMDVFIEEEKINVTETFNNKNIKELLRIVKAGDSIIVYSLKNFGSNLKKRIKTLYILAHRNTRIISFQDDFSGFSDPKPNEATVQLIDILDLLIYIA